MKTLIALLFIVISNSAISSEKRMLNYYRYASTVDSTLPKDSAVFIFDFQNNIRLNESSQLFYSIDGENRQLTFDSTKQLEIQTTPGSHSFKLYVLGYQEIFMDSIQIASKNRDEYKINLFNAEILFEVSKPVIYVYSPIETKATLILDIKGESPFMYPAYENGWDFTSTPSGEITVNEKAYNYLFWDAKQAYTINLTENNTGFLVAGDSIVTFLEEKLSIAGFTTKEKADFITYWAPRMRSNEQLFVQFLFNEQCDQFATMNITPSPDNIYRFYMTWSPTPIDFPIIEQEIPTIKRNGFTIIEWGGIETQIDSPTFLSQNK